MKEILVIVSSAQVNGSSDQLANEWIKGAKAAGHHCVKIALGEQEIQGCRGCGYCQSHDHRCIIDDAMQQYYPLFEKADTIVFASPLYFWTISARMKAFIERLYAISVKDGYPQKDTILLMSGGDDNFWTFEQPIAYYRFVTKALGWNDRGTLCAGGCGVIDHVHTIDSKYLDAAFQMGKDFDN